MKFEHLVQFCIKEANKKESKNIGYLDNILNKLIQYMNNEISKNPSVTMEDINKGINDKIMSYLSEVSDNQSKYRAIEHYLGQNSYSNGNAVLKKYDEIIELKKDKNISNYSFDKERFTYNHNMDNNMEILMLMIIADIRRKKHEFETLDGFSEIIEELDQMSTKERIARIKKIVGSLDTTDEEKRKVFKDIEFGYKLHSKPEKELVEETFKTYTQNSSKILKDQCIKCIRANVNFLDEFGLLEWYVKTNNNAYKKIYINGINYSYEEVKEILKEENLKKLNIEQLILMSSFWTNRVNKVMKDFNKALYIINNKELMKQEEKEDDKVKYSVSLKDMANIDIKMNIIHKLYFELFDQLGEKSGNSGKTINLKRYINGISKKHGQQYKEYCDKLFPNSENSLKQDLMIARIFENVRYNSYIIKGFNMEAMLTCLLNSNNTNIENFGYIEEKDLTKKEVLIGIDLKGFNMPVALHTKKELLTEFLKEYKGNVEFPIYKSFNDFRLGVEDDVLKAQILVPLTKEADNSIKRAAEKVTSRDRYGKAVLHLNYLRKDGKMPEHMTTSVMEKSVRKNKYVREYIDLNTFKRISKTDRER